MKRSNVNDACDRLVLDGFEIVDVIYSRNHIKLRLKREGRLFFIALSSTPSDRRRWLDNVIQNARQAFREGQGKMA